MNGVISRMSKFGFQVNGEDSWLNLSKYEKGLTLDGLNKGDTVSFDVNGKGYLTKLVKLGAVAATSTQTPPAPASGGFAQALRNAGDNDKDTRITRLSALSTAFGAPFTYFASIEGSSVDEAVNSAKALAKELTRYALTGNFVEEDKKVVETA